ncbi:polysaccharide deacetylase family protein [Mesorhizobium sp. M0959]|uniref:polysaccharide deacetylase family protein n=1 Tax=unclassified Mesorhizobium TaxID=325217 RepID=UPI003337492F
MTFDDGSYPFTRRFLMCWRKSGRPATFFVIGLTPQKPELVRFLWALGLVGRTGSMRGNFGNATRLGF